MDISDEVKESIILEFCEMTDMDYDSCKSLLERFNYDLEVFMK